MEQTLQIILNAKDATAAAFNSAKGSMDTFKSKVDDLQPTFKKMALVGTVAFGAISAIAISSFKAFADAEAQTVVTNQSLQNSLNNLSTNQLAKLKSSLGGVTDVFGSLKKSAEDAGKSAIKMGFDDETAANSFSKLFAVTKDVTQANKEMQVAMDLARYKNISLEDATQKLVLVHAGATKELKALGLAVNDGATAMDNIDSIMKQTTGTAQKFSETAEGAMQVMKVSTDNLKESIGGALAPAFNKLKETLVPLVQKFVDWAERNPDLIAKIIMVAGAIAGLVAVFGTLGVILPPIIAFFSLLSLPVLGVIAAIAGVIWIVTECVKIFHLLKDDGDLVWLGIKTSVQEKFTAVKELISKIINGIKQIWTDVWTSIKDFFKGIWDTITSMAQSALNAIKSFLQPILDMINKVIGGLQRVGQAVGSSVGNAVNWIGDKLGINDGIVQNGKVITTHPDDYIVATKDPNSLKGGGVNVIINGGSYLSEDAAYMMGDLIINRLKMELKI